MLLYSSFPPLECRDAAWIALTPLMLSVFGARPKEAFWLGFASGMVFWLATVFWILRLGATGCPWWLAGVGWVLLSAYSAIYMAVFAALVARFFNPLDAAGRWRHVVCAGGIAILWVGLEYLRSNLFTGFPWNTLGVSQFTNLSVIQAAELGGVCAVSFLVALLNAAIATAVTKHLRRRPWTGIIVAHPEMALALTALLAAMVWGCRAVMSHRRSCSSGNLAVVVVQPGIPQVKKWSDDYIQWIYEQLERYTLPATAVKPDLIVWPETAVPDYARAAGPTRDFICRFLSGGVPLLVGSMDYSGTERNARYYNSSFLFAADGSITAGYAKVHLVPFGEYIPLSRIFPALGKIVPEGWNCTPGVTNTVFTLGTSATFSVLICFEDVFPELARRSARNGAKLLINQTNDAWFDGSAASRQHMSHCVFRCVENRVGAVRAANTGVSCFINRMGEITDVLSEKGDTSISGFAQSRVFVPAEQTPPTLYTRFGDLTCGIPCACAVIFFCASSVIAGIRRKGQS